MRYSMPILSSYTSAIARVRLWNSIKNRSRYLVYTDTDSAVMTRPVLEQGEELGDWELESRPDGGIFIRPKMYMLYKDGNYCIKAKGIGSSVRSRHTLLSSISKGFAEIERFTRMKESSRIGIPSGSVFRIVKDIGLEDDKRDWGGSRFNINRWQDSRSIVGV